MTDDQNLLTEQQTLDAAKPAGRHVDCTIEEYHARPEWSNSQRKVLADPKQGPLAFRRKYITGEALQVYKHVWNIGMVVHAALLEPLGLPAICEEIPPEVLSANGARSGKKWDEWAAARPGKAKLKRAEMLECKLMVDRVLGNEEAAALLYRMRGSNEYSVVWHDPECGLDRRCRFDRIVWMPDGGCILVDVKTTRDVSVHGFEREIANWGYHNQAAYYWDGALALGQRPKSWRIIAVQNSEPYDCMVRELHHDDIMLGRVENRATLQELVRRLKADDWNPETYGRLVPARLPEWARREAPVELTIGGEPL